jgi:ergothioneine biosynthesis protein EgtB
MALAHSGFSPGVLAGKLRDARSRLIALTGTLAPEHWLGPYLPTVNPPLWELGHIVWFQEHWCLRLKPGSDPTQSPLLQPLTPAHRPWADWLYNSSRIPHGARWQAPLPTPRETLDYAQQVLDAVSDKLARGAFDKDFPYYAELSLYHELMHTEAWWMMWQVRALAPPHIPSMPVFDGEQTLRIEAGTVELGSDGASGFVFDNEKWANSVHVDAFEIDVHPVTCDAYCAFVDAGGYRQAEHWSTQGMAWLEHSGATHPLFWRRDEHGWQCRRFDRWIDIVAREPVIHVNRFEAEAYCRWRGRTLPSAAQWLSACSVLGFQRGCCWEWTRDMFAPYAGFSPDPYTDYSLPWFHTHAEVRGAGSWVTDPQLARATYRNFFTPERCDPFIGFRTVQVASV